MTPEQQRARLQVPGLPAAQAVIAMAPAPCQRCGQLTAGAAIAPVCDPCRDLERQPQGERMRLFTPAPAQLDGQLDMTLVLAETQR